MSSKANRSTGNLKSHLIKSHKTQYNMENDDPQQPEVTQFYSNNTMTSVSKIDFNYLLHS